MRKNILDLIEENTDDKRPYHFEGEFYHTRSTSFETLDQWMSQEEKVTGIETVKPSAHAADAGVGLIAVLMICFAARMESLGQMRYLLCALICVVWIFLENWVRKGKGQKPDRSSDADQKNRFESLTKSLELRAGIPADAVKLDLFYRHYRVRKGTRQDITGSSRKKVDYENQEFSVYLKNEQLCIANLSEEFSIPLSEIGAVTVQENPITFSAWNKTGSAEEADHVDVFSDCYQTDLYYEMPIGIQEELLIPGYEVESLKKIMDMTKMK